MGIVERSARERGEGRLGLLLALALLGTGIFLGVKIIPVRINAYEFRDFVQEECRYAATRNNDAEIFKRIIDKAKELEIPLDRKNIQMERTTREMIITAKFEQPIDLKFTKYVFKFDQKERAPLF
jgi:hypothetical protein